MRDRLIEAFQASLVLRLVFVGGLDVEMSDATTVIPDSHLGDQPV